MIIITLIKTIIKVPFQPASSFKLTGTVQKVSKEFEETPPKELAINSPSSKLN